MSHVIISSIFKKILDFVFTTDIISTSVETTDTADGNNETQIKAYSKALKTLKAS